MTRTDPITRFRQLLEKAKQSEAGDATACTLATADTAGRPAARMVLLKGVDDNGFVFFTNYGSRKAAELDANPHAALCFYWSSLNRQVRIEGPVARLPVAESDAYFASRPHGSRIAAWASKQTQPLASRADLIARVASYEARFLGREVPRPEFWGGYRLTPQRMEIWHNQLHRLHDRFVYRATADGWERQRLYP
jgi:pyridoxamine 5'-phosphate oxidase